MWESGFVGAAFFHSRAQNRNMKFEFECESEIGHIAFFHSHAQTRTFQFECECDGCTLEG